jgi:hypothetical protein
LVATNNPDKIIFVGEALVGNEAVDQLTKFDRALRDFSSASGVGKGRGIDGMLVTKWDTVDDKVRTFFGLLLFLCFSSFGYFSCILSNQESFHTLETAVLPGANPFPSLVLPFFKVSPLDEERCERKTDSSDLLVSLSFSFSPYRLEQPSP